MFYWQVNYHRLVGRILRDRHIVKYGGYWFLIKIICVLSESSRIKVQMLGVPSDMDLCHSIFVRQDDIDSDTLNTMLVVQRLGDTIGMLVSKYKRLKGKPKNWDVAIDACNQIKNKYGA